MQRMFKYGTLLYLLIASLQLRSVNEAMNEYVSSVSASQPTTALYHTLQRHNDILQDYSQEYNRTKVYMYYTV